MNAVPRCEAVTLDKWWRQSTAEQCKLRGRFKVMVNGNEMRVCGTHRNAGAGVEMNSERTEVPQ